MCWIKFLIGLRRKGPNPSKTFLEPNWRWSCIVCVTRSESAFHHARGVTYRERCPDAPAGDSLWYLLLREWEVETNSSLQLFLFHSAAFTSVEIIQHHLLVVFQIYLSCICFCLAAHPSLIACQITQLVSVLPRTVISKDTQHSFLGIRISGYHQKHIVHLNQLRTPANTKIQLSQASHTVKKHFHLYHIAVLKILYLL